jgi:hypothetical protein
MQGDGGRPPSEQILLAIDERMKSVSPDEQELVKQALLTYPDLPRVLQVVVGQPLVDFGGEELNQYFSQIRDMLTSQGNSQGQPENTQMGNPAQMEQAKATPAAGLNVPTQGPM